MNLHIMNLLDAVWGPIGAGVLLSVLTGAILGFERELHGRAAGFRTTTLVCFASCLLMILSKFAFDEGSFDTSRVAAAAVSGMGFLGAGAIIRQSDHVVQGVTTAATLWCSMAIGLAFGVGEWNFLWLGSGATLLAYIVLSTFNRVEKRILSNRYVDFVVVFDGSQTTVAALMETIRNFPTEIVGLRYGSREEGPLRDVTFFLCYKAQRAGTLSVPLTDRIASLHGVRSALWRG